MSIPPISPNQPAPDRPTANAPTANAPTANAPTANAPTARSAARMDYVDALRGGACLWVLLHHSLERYPVAPGPQHWPLRILVNLANIGWLGVSLFLVLSGFCLYYPLARRAQSLSEIRLDVKQFAKRRATRILPTYYVAMLVYIVAQIAIARSQGLPWSAPFSGFKDIPMHVLMLHNLASSTLGTINSAFWSLALESQLYLIFPLLVALAARRGLRAILLVTFAVAVAWQALAFHRLGFALDWDPQRAQWYHALPGRAFEFACGMSAAALVSRPVSAQTARRCVVIAGLLIVPALFYVARVSSFGPLMDQMWGVIFGCALVLLHRVPASRFRDNALLRALTWTGVISYSLYLIHNLIFLFFPLEAASDTLLILACIARGIGAIGVALVFFVLFEKPFIAKPRQANLVEATVTSPAP